MTRGGSIPPPPFTSVLDSDEWRAAFSETLSLSSRRRPSARFLSYVLSDVLPDVVPLINGELESFSRFATATTPRTEHQTPIPIPRQFQEDGRGGRELTNDENAVR